jgi:carbamoyltransferase
LAAALTAWHQYDGQPRLTTGVDRMKGSYLGPKHINAEIEQFLKQADAPYELLDDEQLFDRVAKDLAEGKVVGWLQGRIEFGPRALGGRSILGDARNTKMQSVMNLKIKYRESFRPFAPSVLRERVSDFFEMNTDSPYMLLVAPLPIEDWELMVAMALLPLAIVEAVKWFQRRASAELQKAQGDQ